MGNLTDIPYLKTKISELPFQLAKIYSLGIFLYPFEGVLTSLSFCPPTTYLL